MANYDIMANYSIMTNYSIVGIYISFYCADLCQVKRSLFRPSLSMGTICERKTKSQTLLGDENSSVPESRKRLSSRQTIDGLCGVQSAGSIPTPKRKRSGKFYEYMRLFT